MRSFWRNAKLSGRGDNRALPQNHTLSAVDYLLASCVREVLAGNALPAWPFPEGSGKGGGGVDGLDESAFCGAVPHRAEFHGIALLLSSYAGTFANWPHPAVDELRKLARLAGLWEELHRPTIVDVIGGLADREIPTLLLKGSALAYLYHPDPAMRRRGDTDLLIREADLERARAYLKQSGWVRPESPHGLYFQEVWQIDCGAGMRHTLDLHWQPSDRPVIQKVLRSDEFWAGRRPVPRLCQQAMAPDPLHMLVHGAFNQAWHTTRGFHVEDERIIGGRRLIWAVDYHHLIKEFAPGDWEALVDFCAERDAGAVVHAALAGAQQDIGLDLPADVLDRLLPASGRSATLEYIRSFDLLQDFQADLRAAGNFALRWRLIWALAFAPRGHLVAKYPKAAHWPTSLLQLRRYGGILRRLLGIGARGRDYHLRNTSRGKAD
jgi:hypothetical protein